MLKFLKYFSLVSLSKDVSKAYKEETGKDRPAYLSRRFVGALIVLAGAFMAVQFGVQIDADILEQVTDSIDKLVAAGMVLYGAIIAIVGVFKRKKDG